jgi:hypothetical protein
LVKWVVPIITACTEAGSAALSASKPSSASRMPVVTSRVVARLISVTTELPSIRTASVCVPPTSIPTRIELIAGLRTPRAGRLPTC